MIPKAKRMELIQEFENRPTLLSLAQKYGLTRNAVAMILYRHRRNKKPNTGEMT